MTLSQIRPRNYGKMNSQNKKQPERKKRLVIVNDVRIYLNSIKQVVDTIKTAGIPCEMEQEFDGDEVVIQLRIKNQKKQK